MLLVGTFFVPALAYIRNLQYLCTQILRRCHLQENIVSSNFLTRIPEPVSTAYVPLLGGVCVRTKGVERHPVKRRKAAGQRRDVHVRNGREMVAGLTAKRKVRTRIQCGANGRKANG